MKWQLRIVHTTLISECLLYDNWGRQGHQGREGSHSLSACSNTSAIQQLTSCIPWCTAHHPGLASPSAVRIHSQAAVICKVLIVAHYSEHRHPDVQGCLGLFQASKLVAITPRVWQCIRIMGYTTTIKTLCYTGINKNIFSDMMQPDQCCKLGGCVDRCSDFLDRFSDFISKPSLVTFSADVSDSPVPDTALQVI